MIPPGNYLPDLEIVPNSYYRWSSIELPWMSDNSSIRMGYSLYEFPEQWPSGMATSSQMRPCRRQVIQKRPSIWPHRLAHRLMTVDMHIVWMIPIAGYKWANPAPINSPKTPSELGQGSPSYTHLRFLGWATNGPKSRLTMTNIALETHGCVMMLVSFFENDIDLYDFQR